MSRHDVRPAPRHYPSIASLSMTSLDSARDPNIHLPNSYRELKAAIRARGFLDKQPFYYALMMLTLASLLGCGITSLSMASTLQMQLANAVLLAFVFGQLGLLGHDAGHNQVFACRRWNTFLGRICGNLLLGMGLNWWREHHNAHHARPNQEGHDPDADLGVLALSPEQARRRHGFERWCSRRQLWLTPFFASLQVFELHRYTIGFLARRRSQSSSLEAFLVAVHFALY